MSSFVDFSLETWKVLALTYFHVFYCHQHGSLPNICKDDKILSPVTSPKKILISSIDSGTMPRIFFNK